MRRDRSQAVVIRNNRILMIKEKIDGRIFFNLPGGGVEDGETPEQAALRELLEETNVHGKIIRKLSVQYKADNAGEVHTFLVEVNDDELPSKGYDPELREQAIVGVEWKKLNEITEIDRMYLWSAGLVRVDMFKSEAKKWCDEISYPSVKN